MRYGSESARWIPVVVLVGLGTAASAAAQAYDVKVEQKQGIGHYLADANGMTLYTFKKDAPGKSACTGECTKLWPVFHRDRVSPQGGPQAENFATIARADGTNQTTYKGRPLYYFSGDKKPGDTNGQGVAGLWAVATP